MTSQLSDVLKAASARPGGPIGSPSGKENDPACNAIRAALAKATTIDL